MLYRSVRLYRLPSDVCFFEEPQIVRWDYETNQWKTDGFLDTLYNEGQLNQPARDRQFLLRDAMRKRGICCRPVSICPSVCLSRWCIVYTQLKIPSNFFIGPVAPLV